MGADIYIDSISQKARDKYEPLFNAAVEKRDHAKTTEQKEAYQEEVNKYYDLMYEDGYFRDSYNSTSVFHQMGLSWWKDVGDLCGKKSNKMPVKNMKKLLKMVEERNIPPIENVVDRAAFRAKLEYATVDDGENSIEKWHSMFVQKRENFIKFLKTAIELNEPIRCSI